MAARPSSDVYAELEWRGAVYQSTDADLGRHLATGPLTLYVGFDATADSLHVGSLLPLLNLQRMQRAGHRPLAVLGGGTTLIGDPSGRETERPLLSPEEIAANAEGIRRQIERFVDVGARPADGLVLNNADWLCTTPLTDFLRDVGKHFTVNAMIAKESVRTRTERDQGISYTEFSYMLLQAYDYLVLHDRHDTRLQMGGSDQWGNIVSGVDLIRRVRGHQVYGVTWPLLTKSDGTKFGKSEGGNVWLDPAKTSPYQFFQYWVRTDDRDVGRFLRLFTGLDHQAVVELERAVEERPAAREAQQVLAWEATALVHGEEAASAAARAAGVLFGGELSDLDESSLLEVLADAPSSERSRDDLAGQGLSLVELLADVGLVPSRSEARRSVAQGGVYVNNHREDDVDRRLAENDLVAGGHLVVRRGKRDYHLVRFR